VNDKSSMIPTYDLYEMVGYQSGMVLAL